MNLGSRVRWRIPDYINPADVACNVGIIIKMELRYVGTPLEKTMITIRFDKGVFIRFQYCQVYEITAEASQFTLE